MGAQIDYEKCNQHPPFDDQVNERLGHYVYGLFDPESGLPFYIGKGGGKDSKGNQRVLDHFSAIRSKLRGKKGTISDKERKILEIWERGQDVEWKILQHGIEDEKSALRIETTLIDTLNACSGISLKNAVSGHKSHLLLDAEVYEWAAKSFEPLLCPEWLRGKPIFLFNTSRALKEGQSREKATRQAWKVVERWRARSGGVALGLSNGVSHTAIRIDGWETTSTPGRWKIVGLRLSGDDAQTLAPRN